MKIAALYDPAFLEHRCEHTHPERPERLAAAIRGLERAGVWTTAERVPLRSASRDELRRVHSERYVDNTLEELATGQGYLDPDTFFSHGSLKAALGAAGGGIDLTMAVNRRDVDYGLALVRPPGHHATWDKAMGFCIFNNIAVSAACLVESKAASRVAIVDWDVHHGNGTQDQFWNNPDVLFISTHQWPHYPGSGAVEEAGGSQALGKTVNIPFPTHADDAAFGLAFDKIIVPILEAFAPDHILVSAGFDAHERDPLAGLQLSTQAYGYFTSKLMAVAKKHSHGRLSFFLEGGYDLEALESSFAAVAGALGGETFALAPGKSASRPAQAVIDRVIERQKAYWPTLS